MTHTVDIFKSQQSEVTEFLTRIYGFIRLGEELGVNIEASVKKKLDVAIDSVSGSKLKIALIGGYSEGKTSIAAAWMGKLDSETMHISQEESSDEVVVYDIDNEVQLIDTPGLFGFKEKFNPGIAELEKYKEITKKYVSEAHLVLYVMDPVNPVKDSHKDDLVWLFRTLNLLPRTVFVLSGFDKVADIEDEEDYAEQLTVKTIGVRARLEDCIQISTDESKQLSIVAIAANPFDKGADYWLQNRDEFNAISRVSALQAATSYKIKSGGGRWKMAEDARSSIVLDVLDKELPRAVTRDEEIAAEVERLQDVVSSLNSKLGAVNGRITDARAALRDFASSYFSDLILQLIGTDLDTFGDFYEREIGDEGIVLNARLQSEFDRHLRSVTLEVSSLQVGFYQEIAHFNTVMNALGKQAVKYMVNNTVIDKGAIFAARKGIVGMAKAVGVDVGKLLKFKPFGAIKAANAVNGLLIAAGVVLEMWDSYQEKKREAEFGRGVRKMKEDLERSRKELLDLINNDQFKETFFPDYVTLNDELTSLAKTLNERSKERAKFHEWRQLGESIRDEFCAAG
ncbi:LeoA/HP0731 family dynamin-like GTPase [Microbulbifer marinus]|uniref:GTPase SAR1 family protein n=1 Tax=Microbulbifer marinus TaxID=658218 RepID=A0A1H3WF84_9GAMM|nr:LeoA/HP0731 family dynamin-like GTPase [Microbulbifer marinus]SDZ85809.1 GTPase SAR1 family protein [Microbulbifer marinus]